MLDYVMIKGRFFWVLSFVLVIGVLFTVGYRERNVKLHPSFQDSSMKGLNLIHKEGDEIKWDLSAKEANFPLGGKEVYLNDIALRLKSSPEIFLTSGKGTYEIESSNILLHESVQLDREDTRFRTKTLLWHGAKDLITTDDDLVISSDQFTIKGRGLTVKLNEEKVRINNNVEAVIYNQ